MDIRPWRILARRILLERPPWFTAGEQDVELPDGTVLRDFNWLTMRSFAIVVPLDEAGRTILARSFKLGVGAVSLSLPAGYLEDGEAPLEGAQRELREETGYEADRWIPLGSYVVDGNYGAGKMHAFLATGARRSASRTAATTRSRSCSPCRSPRRSRSYARATWPSSRPPALGLAEIALAARPAG